MPILRVVFNIGDGYPYFDQTEKDGSPHRLPCLVNDVLGVMLVLLIFECPSIFANS